MINSFKSVADKLRKLKAQAPPHVAVLVGYSAKYALYVHENVEMKGKGLPRRNGKGFYWDPQGQAQAKFLEQPAREMSKELATLIEKKFKETKDVRKALITAGLVLQRASQKLVPVDTGHLKNSAFTKVEGE